MRILTTKTKNWQKYAWELAKNGLAFEIVAVGSPARCVYPGALCRLSMQVQKYWQPAAIVISSAFRLAFFLILFPFFLDGGVQFFGLALGFKKRLPAGPKTL
jgi:hypothetical protein